MMGAPYINIFSFLPFWDIIYETEALFCVCFFLFFFFLAVLPRQELCAPVLIASFAPSTKMNFLGVFNRSQ